MRVGTRDWFFTLSYTRTGNEDTKTFEIRAGGRPAMATVVGLGLLAFYFMMITVLNPPVPWWISAIAGIVFAIIFAGLAGWMMWLAERERQPNDG